jgi:DNA-binding IclR family transcriptional regulator
MDDHYQNGSHRSDRAVRGQRPDANRQNASIGKAATLLRAAARHPDGTSVSQLARDAGIPRATALRMITALEAEGFLVRSATQDRVLLGTGLLGLAAAIRPEPVLIEIAHHHLVELAEATDETVTLAVRHGDEIVGIDEVRGSRVIAPTWVGRSWPLHDTASGRLARGVVPLTEVAESVDELEHGLASIAARIAGDIEAYLTVSGPTYRFGPQQRAAAGHRLLETVRAIARRLGPPLDGPVPGGRSAIGSAT